MRYFLFFLLAQVISAVSLATPPNDAVVTFNEIHYNPGDPVEDAEFVELVNVMAVNVDISGWRLSGGVEYTFEEGTVLPGGGRILVAKSPGLYAGSKGPFTGSLNNSGETLRLRDRNDRSMDELTYGDSGAWPVAADGGGVTLAKRDPFLDSSEAASWAPSNQAGGTPAAENFPAPPGPSTSSVIGRHDTWKVNTSGNAPADWKAPAFNDTAWTSAAAGLQFGNPVIYQDPPPAVAGGQWFIKRWTGDSDSEIASTKTYTHKIGFNRAGAYSPINGVTFDSPGSNVRTGSTWALTGAPSPFVGNGANSLPAGTGSRQLCEEFFYGASNAGATSRLELANLAPGETYIVTFYCVGYGGPLGRQVRLTPSDTGVPYLVDQNLMDSGNGMLVKYRYRAPANGRIAFDFQDTMSATWHHYAFSNEVAPAFIAQTELAGVSIAGASSEYPNRVAANLLNGSGLNNGQHGTAPDGAMWLSRGTAAAPNDPLPAEVTFDLGAAVDRAGVHVWNYNEATGGLSSRGANAVQVQTATTVGGPFTTVSTLNFRRARGVASEPGERFDLVANGVRQVRFIITSTHGGDNDFTGLSEIRFFRQGVPASGPPVPLRENVATLRNTGAAADGSNATPGTNDLAWINVNTGLPAIVMSNHPAWLGYDGVSMWIGASGAGVDAAPAGQFTYRTTFNLSDYDATQAEVKFSVGVDNSLDNVSLNGTPKNLTSAGFGALAGPLTISGPFNAAANTVDFIWSNAGPDPNPAGLRVAWSATAPPRLARSTLAGNPVTTYLRRSFTPTGSVTSVYRLFLDFIADDGAIFYLNGTEIHRVNMPAGTPNASTLAASAVVYPKFNGVIEVPAAALLPGQANVLAVELHQAAAGDADAFFLATLQVEETPQVTSAPVVQINEVSSGVAPTFFLEVRNAGVAGVSLGGYQVRSSSGQSYTFASGTLASGALLAIDQATLGFRALPDEKLFLVAPDAAVADAVIVTDSAQARDAEGSWLQPSSATPGTANVFQLNTAVVINEIMYHHAPAYLATGTISSAEEWVELHNRTNAPVSLTGWKLRGGLDFDFASGTEIPANGYLVVAKDPAGLLAEFPGIAAVGPASGSLANDTDRIRLEDAAGNSVNEVRYYDAGRWDERADGGGSSLELRNPGMDNTVPEAWAASDESAKSQWQTITYSGTGMPFPGTNDPAGYHEFILGLLNAGECLVDDVSVREVSVGNRELIQNGSFATTDKWRNLGNHGIHGRTVVVPDPAAPANPVMKIVATGPTEHMHNHCETTFANGITTNSASTYATSFRARWVSGSPRLQSRLYFNRLARQHLLPMPTNLGTPGAVNSRYQALAGPTFKELTQDPILPAPQDPVRLRIKASDPQGITSVAIKYRADGAVNWSTAPMTLVDGVFEGDIPGHAAGALVQFYIEATDGVTTGTYPAGGTASRAFVRWRDFIMPLTGGHGLRILMSTADADLMHSAPQVMSNHFLPCTVVYREREVFYDARVRLKSSERGRLADTRVGFALEFDPMQKFRGVHLGINIDRSGYGRGTTNSGFGHSEIVSWHFFNRAGGVPSMYNDMVYVMAPRAAHTGSGILTMAEFNDVWADSQFADGADYPTFKYELIYFPTTTDNGTPEGLKLPQPDGVQGVEFGTITSPDKEAYRWNFLIGNARGDDDFRRIINLNDTYRLTGGAFSSAIVNAIDVDQWLRTSAALALAGIGDNYATTTGAWHNLKLYHRADGRILYLPWDLDFQDRPATDSVIINPDISALVALGPSYQRLFYQHLQDIIATSFNRAYLEPWVSHYASFSTAGGNWNDILTYVDQRVSYVQGLINTNYPFVPFDITTANSSTSQSSATINGNGWLNVRTIVVQSGGLSLPVTWTGGSSWQVSVPISPGQNVITLLAFDYQGNQVGSDTVTVTGTGTVVPAAAGNLVVSEVHYHPAAPSGAEVNASADKDEFEFIEVQNISATQSVNLGGCRFEGGLDYTFPNTTLAPLARAVIPRNTAAFAARYPSVPTLNPYYQANTNFLANSGETFSLVNAQGTLITRVTYGDSGNAAWPTSPDGSGPSLVLVAPRMNPNAENPLHWRASATVHGNPGSSDALPVPASPLADSDGNGIQDLVQYALGSSVMPSVGTTIVSGQRRVTLTIDRNPRADAAWSIQGTNNASGPWNPADASFTITGRTALPDGRERLTLTGVNTLSPLPTFIRARLSVP